MRLILLTCLLLPSCVKNSEIKHPPISGLSKRIVGLIDTSNTNAKIIKLGKTKFHIYGRKHEGIGVTIIEKSLRKMWPGFSKYFIHHPREVAIIDFEAPIGGGPLAPFVIGIYYSKSISKKSQQLIKESSGWPLRGSTSEYVDAHYLSFSNPLEAYVDDILVHEFGHVFFGWGLTSAKMQKQDTLWFSLGMGLVYDRMAWNELYSLPSPLFSALISEWMNKFSHNEKIDQRLVKPNTDNDKKFGLRRIQTFGHGKSYVYLTEIRKTVGPDRFDRWMNNYLNAKGIDAVYDSFLKLAPKSIRNKVSELERKYQVR